MMDDTDNINPEENGDVDGENDPPELLDPEAFMQKILRNILNIYVRKILFIENLHHQYQLN